MRRREIFEHIENIRNIGEARLDACDQSGNRLIDLDLLPEPNPICGTEKVQLERNYPDCAQALHEGADFLYDDLWKAFCRDFEFKSLRHRWSFG